MSIPARKREFRNPAWTRVELILALELYFRYHPSSINKNGSVAKRLAGWLKTDIPMMMLLIILRNTMRRQ
ncbi:MAG: hypothetical protein JWM44_4268 [Bacilli bacterium]|nr:hypothetical protein [Bacilli bacterium]